MDPVLIIIIVAITAYLIWLVIYLLLIDRVLRYFVGLLFGVTIESRIERPVGQPNLLDALTMFSWRVIEPSGWPLRLTVGCIRVTFWLVAMIGPIVLAFLFFVWLRDHVAK